MLVFLALLAKQACPGDECDTSPSKEASPTNCDVNCRLPEFSISATSGQDCCCAAIAKKSTGCATAIAAKTCHSWAANPSSSQSSEGGRQRGCFWLCVGRWPLSRQWAAKGIRDYIFLSWCVPNVRHKFGNEKECRCLRANQGGMVRNRAVTSGLWSVRRRKCRPSSRNRKCWTALKAASSSLLNVEYRVPAPDGFFK